MQLDEEQQAALALMQGKCNVFLTGKAGTGKSTVLHEFRRWCDQNDRSCAFLAPTGVAAMNIQGATLHSYFRLPPSLLDPGTIGRFKGDADVINRTASIVIDEISMVRSDMFAAIDFRLRTITKNMEAPFGGKQIIVVGDFYQLPPVVGTTDTIALLKKYPEKRSDFYTKWVQEMSLLTDEEWAAFLEVLTGNPCAPGSIPALRANPDQFQACLQEFFNEDSEAQEVDTRFEMVRDRAPKASYAYGMAAELLMTTIYGGVFSFQARQWDREFGGEQHAANFQTLWNRAEFHPICLSQVHRQNEQSFCRALDAIRDGQLDRMVENEQTAVDYLGNKIGNPADGSLILCPTNGQVRNINNSEWEANAAACMNHPQFANPFTATMTGSILKSYVSAKQNGREKSLPTDVELKLWPGAKVMLLKNEPDGNGGYLYVNGTMGQVVNVEVINNETLIVVKLDHNGIVVRVRSHTWSEYKYELDRITRRLMACETGTFTQYPIRLAYAITIHKSQGLSLDRVHLELGNGCFANGQLYTALTRCRTYEGLSLDRWIEQSDMKRDAQVAEFYRTCFG